MEIKQSLCALALIVAVVSGGVARADKLGVVATLVSVKGEVEVWSARTGEWRIANEGDLITSKDLIRTRDKSECAVKWLKGNMVKLLPDTELEFKQMRMEPSKGSEETLLVVKGGSALFKSNEMDGANSAYVVQTANGAASLDEATLFVDAGSTSATRMACLSGTVRATGANGAMVALPIGQEASISRGQIVNRTQAELGTGGISAPGLMEGTPDETAAPVVSTPSADVVDDDEGDTWVVVNSATKLDFTMEQQVPADGGTVSPGDLSGGASGSVGGGPSGRTGQSPDDTSSTVTPPASEAVDDNAGNTWVVINNSSSITFGKTPVASNTPPPFSLVDISGDIQDDFAISNLMADGKEQLARESDTQAPQLILFQPQMMFSTDGNTCSRRGDRLTCTVSGLTEPGARLMINDIVYTVDNDGTFSHLIEMDMLASIITVVAEDASANREVKRIDRNPRDIAFFDVSASPSTVIANGLNTLTITVHVRNFMMEPVDGVAISMESGDGGTLSSSSLVSSGGVATVVFTPALAGYDRTVNVTARAGHMSDTLAITVLADFPPVIED